MRKSISPIRLISLISPISPIRLISPICLIGLICLISLTACSSGDDVAGDEPSPTPVNPPIPEPQTETAITFRSGLADEEAVTRATGLEEVKTSFKVWAYKNTDAAQTDYQTVIDGYTVSWTANTANTTTSNTNDWEYVGISDQTIKYWDWSAKAYRFFGMTGDWTNEPYEVNTANRAYTTTTMVDARTPAALPYFSKLRYCTNNDYGKTVQLVFVQPYSRVRFMFTYSYPDANIMLTDKSFRPTDNTKTIPLVGKVTVSYPLTGAATQEAVSLSNITAELSDLTQDYYESTDENDPNRQKWYYVLPAQDQGTYTLTVSMNGEKRTTVVPAEYMNWKPGYQYTYIFKITEEGGVELDSVSSAFTEWTEQEANHPVYNW